MKLRTESVYHAFAYEVYKLRQDRGLTQSQLADLAGIDRSCFVKLESGQRKVTLEDVRKIASALDIRELELLVRVFSHG